jgi:hypothetical protein
LVRLGSLEIAAGGTGALMRKGKIAVLCFVVVLLVGIAWVGKEAMEANDFIGRCLDESSPAYIEDVKLRKAACKD